MEGCVQCGGKDNNGGGDVHGDVARIMVEVVAVW